MSRRIFKNLIDLATGTFVSRIFGFMRELITAAFYGTNRAMDLFVIAFTIPAFFRQVLGEDVVERAFLPPFKRLISQKNYKHGWQLLSSCFNLMILAILLLMTILYLIVPLIVKLIAPGLAEDIMPQAILMTYWILPFMFLIGMAAFVGGIMNFFEMNKVYSLAPAMLSVGVIIGIFFFRGALGVYALPAGFLLGAFLELIIQLPFLFVRKIKTESQACYYPQVQIQDEELKRVGRESGFIFLKSLLDKSVEIVDRMLASFLISGSIASLWFAHRLVLLPVAIIGLAISRSLIPYLTEKKALDENEEFLAGIKLGIQLNFTLVLPTIMIMLVMAHPIISIVYQRGVFDAESTRLTAIAFWCYSVGLLGLSIDAFLARIFSIFQKNKIPFYVAIFGAFLNIVLNFILVKTPLKHGGIALASSIAFSVNGVFLFYFLWKEIRFQIKIKTIMADLLKIGSICLIVGFSIHYFYQFVLYDYLTRHLLSEFIQNILALGIVSGLAIILYLGLLLIFGPKEIKNRVKKILPGL
jgi:putative peptidoglycan lipid II flippase